MKSLPHYTKVITLGSSRTENALVGEVIVQEKIDGSQLRFGINEDGEVLVGSKSVTIQWDTPQKLFKPAVDYIFLKKSMIKTYPPDTYFFAETLCKPKHNVLNYEKVPANHIVLFDVLKEGKWVDRKELETIAEFLGIDVIPELYRGIIERKKIKKSGGTVNSSAIGFLKRIIETTPSYLGKELIEGVVIKNYNQTILLGGHVFPLFTKYVREQYKERHQVEWKNKSPKGALQEYIEGFKSETRWQKAVIHLKEKGELENNPRDIGKLLKQVNLDIIEEETENIKNELYKKFIKTILRNATKGLAEWYKEKLLENVK